MNSFFFHFEQILAVRVGMARCGAFLSIGQHAVEQDYIRYYERHTVEAAALNSIPSFLLQSFNVCSEELQGGDYCDRVYRTPSHYIAALTLKYEKPLHFPDIAPSAVKCKREDRHPGACHIINVTEEKEAKGNVEKNEIYILTRGGITVIEQEYLRCTPNQYRECEKLPENESDLICLYGGSHSLPLNRVFTALLPGNLSFRMWSKQIGITEDLVIEMYNRIIDGIPGGTPSLVCLCVLIYGVV